MIVCLTLEEAKLGENGGSKAHPDTRLLLLLEENAQKTDSTASVTPGTRQAGVWVELRDPRASQPWGTIFRGYLISEGYLDH